MKSKILFMILLILSLSFSFSSHSWGASKRSKVDGSTKIIEANDIEKQFAKLQNVMSERQHLEKRLSKVGEWLPLWIQMKKDINVEKLLKQLHKRLAEIKQQEQKLRESLPVWNPPGKPAPSRYLNACSGSLACRQRSGPTTGCRSLRRMPCSA